MNSSRTYSSKLISILDFNLDDVIILFSIVYFQVVELFF